MHAQVCAPWCGDGVPPVLKTSPHYLIKGYSATDRIVYGTGEVVLSETLIEEVQNRLRHAGVAYVDVRSARNNCFQARAFPDPAPEP